MVGQSSSLVGCSLGMGEVAGSNPARSIINIEKDYSLALAFKVNLLW